MQRACSVSLNFKSRYISKAKLMSVSTADLELPTELEKSRLLITAGADGEAVREAMKKRRRELAFSCVSSDACRLRGTHAGDFYIAVSGQKFLRIVKGLFSKSPLTGGLGRSPACHRGTGRRPVCNRGSGQRPVYILRGARQSLAYIRRGLGGAHI